MKTVAPRLQASLEFKRAAGATRRAAGWGEIRDEPAGREIEAEAPAKSPFIWAVVAAVAGLLTPFTVSLVGEMPVGEPVLILVFAWAAFTFALTRQWPSPLLKGRWFWGLMACQAVALAAYMVSDFYRGSSGHDMARGWGRMVFLAIDVTAVACLFGKNPRNLLFLIGGLQAGTIAEAAVHGPLFGDWWKFGVGVPLTFAGLGLAAQAGPVVAALAAAGFGLVNFVMDFRSVGGLCLAVAAMIALQIFPKEVRRWVVPFGMALALVLVAFVYHRAQASRDDNRTDRSNIDRSAMMQAAWEAFRSSPLIGQGSWFSHSNVLSNYLFIRDAAAREAHLGGFADPNDDVESVSIHSQLLVALAEGGIVGATFFFAFGAGLLWALQELVLNRSWTREGPVRMLVLLLALFNLGMSPFSGAHRVYIAMAAGLVMIVAWERSRASEGEDEEASA